MWCTSATGEVHCWKYRFLLNQIGSRQSSFYFDKTLRYCYYFLSLLACMSHFFLF